MLYGGIEAGGTKMICCVGNEKGDRIDEFTFMTTTPKRDISTMVSYFKEHNIAAIGAGWFGPLDLNPNSKTYGSVLNTPKLEWKNFNVKQALEDKLSIPVRLETDVNAALIGEVAYGSAIGLKNAIYITVGTGIGIGALVNGKILQGLSHPEAGHIFVNKNASDKFGGSCPYHGCCLEGLASGPAIEKRWGMPGDKLIDNEEVWILEADYLAQAICNYMLLLSPERIILGGGVMKQSKLFPLIRQAVKDKLAGYVDLSVYGNFDEYIVPSKLNGKQAILGCLKMAQEL